MRLDQGLQIVLVERFSPILCIDPTEPDFPVSPIDYIAGSALWASDPPAHARMGWGQPDPAGRAPLVPRGAVAIDASGDLLNQIGEGRGVARELWLDPTGWQDGPDVSAGTLNRRAHVSGSGSGAQSQPWFVCDAWTYDDLAADLGDDALAARFGLRSDEVPPSFDDVAVLTFGFMFPAHRQPRRRTARDPADDPWSGDYQGDWCHFSVVLQATAGLEATDPASFSALFGCFGQRYRGTHADRDDHATARARLRPWAEMMLIDDHPVIVASDGIHNLYPHDQPRYPGGSLDPQFVDWGKSVSEPANGFVQSAVEQPGAIVAVKVIAGAAAGSAIGGLAGAIVGAVVGGIAAAAELIEAEKEGLYEAPELPETVPPSPPGEDPLEEDAQDLAKQSLAKPAVAPLPAFFDPTIGQAKDWLCAADAALEEGRMAVAIQNRAFGGTGRWGVRCDRDSLIMRSGLRLPGYRQHVADALLIGS